MKLKIIQGCNHTDNRGTISFVNNFNMNAIRRFYTIHHPNTSIIRAWQGHKIEAKYFHVIKGSFRIALVKPDNWDNLSKNLPVEIYELSENNSQILHVPGGYFNGFKAIVPDSILIVFSDKTIEESTDDDYRFPKDYWKF